MGVNLYYRINIYIKSATKKILLQRKFKKYNNLKYKPKPAVKSTKINGEYENLKKVTYARYCKLTKYQQGD